MGLRKKIATRPYRKSSYLFPAALTAKRKASYTAPSCRQGCSRLRHRPRPLLERPSSSRLRLLNLYTIRVGYVPSKKHYAPRRARKYAQLGLKRERQDLRKRAQGEVPEDRCQSAGRTLAETLSPFVLAEVRGVLPTGRMPAMVVWGPAAGPSTSPLAASRRRSFGLIRCFGRLADSPRPRRTATEQAPQPALQHGPGHQTVLVGYGDDHRQSLPAVLSFHHPVREAPRVLVPEEPHAVGPGRPPGPLEQRRGACRGIYAQGPCHAAYLLLLEDLLGADRVLARNGPAPRATLVWRTFLPGIPEFATQWISLPQKRQNRPPPLPGDSRLRCWLCPSLIQRPKSRRAS